MIHGDSRKTSNQEKNAPNVPIRDQLYEVETIDNPDFIKSPKIDIGGFSISTCSAFKLYKKK